MYVCMYHKPLSSYYRLWIRILFDHLTILWQDKSVYVIIIIIRLHHNDSSLLLHMEQRGQSVCVSVCVHVCLSVLFVRPAKTVEPIDVPFGGLSRMDPRNHY